MNRTLTTAVVILSFLVIAIPVHAQGKSQEAPGKAKDQATSNDSSNKTTRSKPELLMGTVEEVENNSITFSENGKKKTASVSAHTKVYNKNNKQIKLGSLKIKDLIAVISTDSASATNSAVKGKKVTKIYVKEASAAAQSKRRAVAGVITQVEGNQLTISHPVHQNRQTLVTFNDATTITGKAAKTATASASVAALTVGQRVAAVGDLNDAGLLVAKRIHLIPGLAKGLPTVSPKPKASPSATPSASPTASPSASPSPTTSATPSASPEASPSPTL